MSILSIENPCLQRGVGLDLASICDKIHACTRTDGVDRQLDRWTDGQLDRWTARQLDS